MSQYESNPYMGDEAAPGMRGPARTSGLAIAALVCSLILCCPVTTLVGPLLGLIALVSIRGNPQRKGTGLAVSAIVIGLIATVLWIAGIAWSWKNMYEPQQLGPRGELAAAFAGDYSGFRQGFYGNAATATDEQIKVFTDDLTARYGTFVTSRMDEQKFSKNMDEYFKDLTSPVKTYPYVLEFSNETVEADIEISAQDPSTGQFLGRMKFGRITVLDADEGDLEFPPPN